jgi:ABC-type lipoprotein release transport system permease subunit
MRTAQLLERNLLHYWRTNLAVVLGVATAVAVLAGALLVGDSVRASLRDLVVQRLGQTDLVITSSGFFRDQLATDMQSDSQFANAGFAAACPLIAIEGTVMHEPSKRVGSRIKVYGVDDRFWSFHHFALQAPRNRDVFLSEAFARELGAAAGDSIVLRVEKPSAIPIESLHSRKEDLGSTLRLTVRQTVPPEALGEFSLQPQQGAVRAVFVPLSLLQKELDQAGKVNLILIAEKLRGVTTAANQPIRTELLQRILKDKAGLEDYGIKLRVLNEQQVLSVESFAGYLPETLAGNNQKASPGRGDFEAMVDKAAHSSGNSGASSFLSYLVNSIRRDDGREIPYSIVTGIPGEMMVVQGYRIGCDLDRRGSVSATADLPPIMLNEWAGSDLQVKLDDHVTLDYYVWLPEGKLATRSTEFRVACILPMEGLAVDRDLVPDYPGITESESLGDWDPPFPIDLKRVRPQDEDYWKKYRTAPKAFIALGLGQELWQSRFGKLTSLRLAPREGQTLAEMQPAFEQSLLAALDPLHAGFAILPTRAQALEAARGATDFGEYFLYFSFFLVISALMLSALFFKLGIEQRLREIGLLQAVGFPAAKIRRLFLAEGLLLAIIGSLIGLAGAIGYGQFVIVGLRTWWVDAVGTTMLRLHVSPLSLGLGAAGGIIAALLCIVWTLRGLGKESTRTLLSGIRGNAGQTVERAMRRRLSQLPHFNFSSQSIGTLLVVLALALLIAAAFQRVNQVAGFFGGGTLVLAAALCYQSGWLRRPSAKPIAGTGWWSVTRLGFRNATSRPGRSVLCIALIASAAFIIVAVDSFRHRGGPQLTDRKSGNGGFPLLAESLLPIVHNPNTSEGREALNLNENDGKSPLSGLNFASFRVRPGDDASCLNLYQPRNPKIIAPTDDFVRSNRFAFQDSLATTEEEKNNPWLLLNREFSDGVVPVIADANSLTYVLHRKLGDDLNLDTGNGPVRLRLVGSLADSVFQSELVMGEANFVRLFPDQQGYRFFLIDTPTPEQSSAVATRLEDRLSDFGFDVQATSERLAGFHRVENTYLSTFQMLGGLGLVLGTLGMAAVLLRNVLERRRELALLRVVGYNSSHFALMVIAENALLLCCGLITGAVCALLAIAPVFFTRHAQLPSVALGLLLLGVLISGLTASVVATWAALRSPLLPALRAE